MTKFQFGYLVIALAICFYAKSAQSQEPKFILGVELGQSSVNIDTNKIQTDVDFDDNGFAGSYFVGYRWANHFVNEVNLTLASNNFIFRGFDFYETKELKLLFGYSFQLADSLRIVPMAGMSRWELNSREGLIFNPGPEQNFKFEGTDLTYKLTMEYLINDSFALSLSYARTHLVLGTTELSLLGLKFEF